MYDYDNRRTPKREIPSTTALRVIFTFDKKPKKYYRDSYSPQLTDGRVSTQEIDHVLSQIEDIRNPSDSKLLMTTFVMCGIVFFLFCAVCYLVLNGFEKSDLLIVPALGLVITLLIGVMRIMYLHKKFEDDCEEVCKNDINRKFASRGIKWKIAKEWPFWVELHNNFRLHGGSTKQQTAQPTAQQTDQERAQQIAQQTGIANQNAGGHLHLQIYQGEPQYKTNLYTPYVPPSQY